MIPQVKILAFRPFTKYMKLDTLFSLKRLSFINRINTWVLVLTAQVIGNTIDPVLHPNPSLVLFGIFRRFANKQDVDGALSEEDIELQFELDQLAKKCKSRYKVVSIQAEVAYSQSGIVKEFLPSLSKSLFEDPFWCNSREFFQP